jgi:hypothetical protein
MSTDTKPAKIRLPAPSRLASTLAAIGFKVTLRIERAEEATVDPGSDPGPVDAEITDDEIARIKATIKAYEVGSKADKGEKFKAPKK